MSTDLGDFGTRESEIISQPVQCGGTCKRETGERDLGISQSLLECASSELETRTTLHRPRADLRMVFTRVLPLLLVASSCAAALHEAHGMPAVSQAPLRLKGGMGLLGGAAKFDPSVAQERIDNVWKLDCDFGREAEPHFVYFEEIIPDRFSLTKGMQLIRDEVSLL